MNIQPVSFGKLHIDRNKKTEALLRNINKYPGALKQAQDLFVKIDEATGDDKVFLSDVSDAIIVRLPINGSKTDTDFHSLVYEWVEQIPNRSNFFEHAYNRFLERYNDVVQLKKETQTAEDIMEDIFNKFG